MRHTAVSSRMMRREAKLTRAKLVKKIESAVMHRIGPQTQPNDGGAAPIQCSSGGFVLRRLWAENCGHGCCVGRFFSCGKRVATYKNLLLSTALYSSSSSELEMGSLESQIVASVEV